MSEQILGIFAFPPRTDKEEPLILQINVSKSHWSALKRCNLGIRIYFLELLNKLASARFIIAVLTWWVQQPSFGLWSHKAMWTTKTPIDKLADYTDAEPWQSSWLPRNTFVCLLSVERDPPRSSVPEAKNDPQADSILAWLPLVSVCLPELFADSPWALYSSCWACDFVVWNTRPFWLSSRSRFADRTFSIEPNRCPGNNDNCDRERFALDGLKVGFRPVWV